MWILRLNPMVSNAENSDVVARAETKAKLVTFVNNELVEPYKDNGWHKVFRQGGPLEWYNPPDDNPWFSCFYDVGTLRSNIEQSIANTTRLWNELLAQTREV